MECLWHRCFIVFCRFGGPSWPKLGFRGGSCSWQLARCHFGPLWCPSWEPPGVRKLIFGVGAISGPILCSLFMEWFGLNGFFVFLILAHALIGAFGLYRMRIRETVDNPDSTFTPVPATITPAGLELDPDTPATLDENPVNETAKP